MPKMSCCTKASFYAKFCLSFTEGKQLLLDELHLCCIYTIITQLLEYTKANSYAKLCNNLGLSHIIGFMIGSYLIHV